MNDFTYGLIAKLKIYLIKIQANLRNINYESKNVNIYKNEPTNEIFVSGIIVKINFEKLKENSKHF